MAARFIPYKDNAGEWRWKLVADGIGREEKIIADGGEGYKNKKDCIAEIRQIKRYAPVAPILTPKK